MPVPAPKTERNARIVLERARGDTLQERARNLRERRATARKAVEEAKERGDLDSAEAYVTEFQQACAELENATKLQETLLRQIAGYGGGLGAETVFDDPSVVNTLEQL